MAAKYEVGDILRYFRTSKETGIGKGKYAQVKTIDFASNPLTVGLQDGTERTYADSAESPSSVLIHLDTELATRDLLNNRMAYVSVSCSSKGRTVTAKLLLRGPKLILEVKRRTQHLMRVQRHS